MQTTGMLKNKNQPDQTPMDQLRSKQEIEECVRFVRLELYNRDMPCGAKAVRERLEKFYHVKPLPSERTIARILARHGFDPWQNGNLCLIEALWSLPSAELSSGQTFTLYQMVVKSQSEFRKKARREDGKMTPSSRGLETSKIIVADLRNNCR